VEVMVDALNEAIVMLVNENPNNRIAVVAFGGDSGNSRIVPILKLGHYNVTDGKYFSMRSAAYIQVSSQIPDTALFGAPPNRNVRVFGGTPIQRGIYAGAQILLDNSDTTYSYTSKGQTITVIRKPNIVLLGDGGATLGWTDYKFENPASDTDSGFDCGDANNTDMGLSTLTVLTASYFKQQIQDHYYGADETSKAVSFYTIGLDLKSEGANAPAALDPINNAQNVSRIYLSKTYNMKSVLDDFIALPVGENTSFPALNKGSSSARRLVNATNDDSYIKSYNYTDGYYTADNAQALTDAFQAIARKIISSGNYVIKKDPDGSPFGTDLVFSDVLGEYMEFKGSEGLWFDNRMYDGHLFAQSMTASSAAKGEFVEIMLEYLEHRDNPDEATARKRVEELLDSCIEAGKRGDPEGLHYTGPADFSNKIKYYADSERNWVGNYFNSNGTPADVPNSAMCIVDLYTMQGTVKDPVNGEDTDLMAIAVHVVTALADGKFECVYSDGNELVRDLKKGQQVIRWYIPASLIPMRTVSAKYDGDEITGVQIKETLPICYIYAVGLRDGLILADMDSGYKAANKAAGEDAYYFYTNAWKNTHNVSMTFFQPDDTNPYYYHTEDDPLYVRKGDVYEPAASYTAGTDYYTLNEYFDADTTGYLKLEYVKADETITDISGKSGVPYIEKGALKSLSLGAQNKSDNPTGTKTFVIEGSGITADGKRVQKQLLGNNGQLKLPFTEVEVTKIWFPNGTPSDEYVQLYANGIPAGEPVPLTDFNSDSYIWEELPLYRMTPNSNGEVDFIEYTVAEGTWDGSAFTPYPLNYNSVAGLTVFYRQPEWNEVHSWWDEAYIVNYDAGYDIDHMWHLTIEKEVNGDIPDWQTGTVQIEFEVLKGDADTGTPVIPLQFPYIYPFYFTDGAIHILIEEPGDYTIIEKNKGMVPGYSCALSVDTDYGDTEDIPGGNGIFLKGVMPGNNVTVTFTNTYEDVNFAELTLEKKFSGDIPPGDDHTHIAFEVVGENPAGIEIYRNTVYYDDFDTFDRLTLERLKPGTYTITELGGDAAGYNMTISAEADTIPWVPVGNGLTVTLSAGDSPVVEFNNDYKKYGSLTIEKTIIGLDVPVYPADIVFYVAGNGVIYDRYIDYSEFDGSGKYVLDDIPPGNYTVTETGGKVGGYIMTMNPVSGMESVIMDYTDKTVKFENKYDMIPVPPSPILTIKKMFVGLDPSQYPEDIAFHIAKDGGGNITVDYGDFVRGEYSVELDPGTYTITESEGAVTGYTFAVNHTLGYKLPLNYGDEETVIFVNTYTESPPAPTADAVIAGTKAITGTTGSTRVFTFDLVEVTDETGTEALTYTDTVKITGAGEFIFTLNALESGKTYYYKITENQSGSGGNWTYSNNIWIVKAEVSDKGDGTAEAEVTTVSSGGHIFTNHYRTSGGGGGGGGNPPTPAPPPVPTPTPVPPSEPSASPEPPIYVEPGDPAKPPVTPVPVEPDAPAEPTVYAPPNPSIPGNTLVPDGSGYIETDKDGTPFGRWMYNDETGEWVFSEIEHTPVPSTARLPQTGMIIWPIPVLFAAGLLMIILGWLIIRGRKRNAA